MNDTGQNTAPLISAKGSHQNLCFPTATGWRCSAASIWTSCRARVWPLSAPSGVGKSTLLHIIGTWSGPPPERIIYGMTRKSLPAMMNSWPPSVIVKIGFVFQFHHLLPEFDALENVMLPGLIARLSKAAAHGNGRKRSWCRSACRTVCTIGSGPYRVGSNNGWR